ncbi:MAG: exodeoxyribonuclease III [Bacteroidales bacterium]|jgi:exodeoxyribonuclease-3|nr:exodeoxyribonuclease III [Bacteroidales bacterium]
MLKKIFSYNVNGLRAAMNKGFDAWLEETQPDVLCLQETKMQPEQMDFSAFDRLGYRHYWFSAQKKGYSGVGILTKIKPDKVVYGMGTEKYDTEGRMIRADYGDVSVISAYIPSGTSGAERQAFKMVFLDDFLRYLNELRKERPRLIIAGDYNIAHTDADINFPRKHDKMSGFLPEEREWFTRFLAEGYVDTFRLFHSEPNRYSWWSYRSQARAKDLGWRIDYHIATADLQDRIRDAGILQSAEHSDHCPVTTVVEFM